MTMLNAFSVDVEDYYHVTAFEQAVCRSTWSARESRVVDNTSRLLDLLAEQNVIGTFFILGWVAERHPKLVERIHRLGHEVGSHSYWHRLIYQLTPEEFRDDLRQSKAVLEDVTGQAVRAYRAPCFSITNRSLWALEILCEEGIQFDSSIFPVRHDRYGIPNAPCQIHPIYTPSGTLWEVPPSVWRHYGWNLPVAGGGYFRLMPSWWTRWAVQSLNQQQSRPFIFYIHPWEIDPQQPRLSGISRVSAWRHYLNLHSTERKLRDLVQTAAFGSIGQVVGQWHQDESISILRPTATVSS